MRILVTGAAGLIGSWIAQELKLDKHSVMTVDDLSGGLPCNVQNLAGFLEADLTGYVARQAIRQFAPQAVFHCAANAREGASHFQPLAVAKSNVDVTMNTLEAAVLGKSLKKFIYFSSIATYGDYSDPPFDESLPPRPVDVYGCAKFFCETAIPILADVHGFKYTILKPHNVYGPHQVYDDPYRNVVTIFLHHVMRGEPVCIFGDGKQTRAFSYVEDSLPCYVRCLHDADGEIVNIGGKIAYSINELLEIVKNVVGHNFKTIYLPARMREAKHAWSTTIKSEAMLGYKEQVSLNEGVKRTFEWMQKEGIRPWRSDDLPLMNDKAPKPWRDLAEQKEKN